MKAVIVDDDKAAAEALADLLETKYGIEVTACALCGLDGLIEVGRCQPDVLFLDVQLPDISGLDFLDRIAATQQHLRVVMYTAYDECVLTAFRKRAFDVLLKPISTAELDTIVQRLQQDDEEMTPMPTDRMPPSVLHGKMLCYTNSVDFKVVDKGDVGLFRYDHDARCWEVVLAGAKKPIRLKRNVKSTDLLALDNHFLQVNQKFIVNVDYLTEVVDNVCHFYPPFDDIDYVKVGRLFRKKLIDRFLNI